MEKIDVVIVGGGLAGLSCAYALADSGLSIIVLERGDFAGSKNVTGGRIYLNPIRDLFPDLWKEAPLERRVTKEIITLMSDDASTSFELSSRKFNRPPYHSYTILRSKFDKWLSEKVIEKGVFVIPQKRVDEIIKEAGKVVGVKVGNEEIRGEVVVAADGALSLIAQKAGLKTEPDPKDFALGIKEIIKLPAKTIEERFNIDENEGVAQIFAGSLTHGMTGGGFLYTNQDTISLGIVLGIKSLMEKIPLNPPFTKGEIGGLELYHLMDEFKERPEIRHLIKGGELVEYSSHLIPEGGLNMMPQVYSDGILVIGDAAGLCLNMLFTVRGMDFAIASGHIAAQAIKRANQRKVLARAGQYYQELLDKSFIMSNLKTFKGVSSLLENPRLFNLYPQMICNLFEKIMWIGSSAKPKISKTILKEITKNFLSLKGIKDIFDIRKI